MSVHSFTLFADYFQVYLMDETAIDDTSVIWTDKALEAKLGVSDGTLAVGTFRNVDVNLEVEILAREPDVDLSSWDHASLGYVSFPSGVCAVFGCTDYFPEARRIELPKGHYAALSLAKGLDSISVEWEPANDFYKVYLWQSNSFVLKPLKRYAIT